MTSQRTGLAVVLGGSLAVALALAGQLLLPLPASRTVVLGLFGVALFVVFATLAFEAAPGTATEPESDEPSDQPADGSDFGAFVGGTAMAAPTALAGAALVARLPVERSRLAAWFTPIRLIDLALGCCALALFTNAGKGFTLLSATAWLASVAFGIASAVRSDRQQFGARADAQGDDRPRAEIEIVVALTFLAAALRWYLLDQIPAGLWFDEAVWGLDARSVGRDAGFPVYFEANFGHPFFFIYVLAGFTAIFGEHAWVLRLAASLFGIAAVPAIYLLGRELFGWRVGLIAAFLLAVSRWHLNFSRIAFDAITMLPFQILAFYFLARGWRTRRQTDFALAGLFFAAGLYTYAASRLLPFLAAAFVAHLLLARRRPLRSLVRALSLPLGVALLVFFLVGAPLAQFAARYPNVVNNRVQTVSTLTTFTNRTPAEALAVVAESTRQHLLMFNVAGDRNGRHNLPGEPMLDPGTGALFVLGVGVALWRWRRPRYLLLLTMTATALAAGIFSLAFEAPQSLRAIGAIPAVVILAALPVARIWSGAAALDSRVVRRSLAALATVGLTAIAGTNYQNYFVRQANDGAVWESFSTAETIIAAEMQRLGPDWRFHVMSYYNGHPTLRFLVPWAKNVAPFETTDTLPLAVSGQATGSGSVALFLDGGSEPIYRAAKLLYPNAAFRAIGLPGRNPIVYEALLTPSDLTGIQGLRASYYAGARWSDPPAFTVAEYRPTVDWAPASPAPRTSQPSQPSRTTPLAAPFGVEWSGVLRVPAYGEYALGVRSPAEVELWLDGVSIGGGTGRVDGRFALAKGNHALRYRVTVPEAAGQTLLYWQPPGKSAVPIPRDALYLPPVASVGLLGSYYKNDGWSGPPAFQRIDPLLALYYQNTLLPRPYTVEWSGDLNVRRAGTYRFGLETIGDTWLSIDGKQILAAYEKNRYVESASVDLSEGPHRVNLRYADRYGSSHVYFFWTPPGQPREIVPSEALRPAVGESVARAGGPDAVRSAPPPVATVAPRSPLPDAVAKIWGGDPAGGVAFREPRDVAVDRDGNVYVADAANARVVKLNARGEPIATWGEKGTGEGQFAEMVALVVDSRGDVLVLDAESGWIERFSPAGEFRDRLGGPKLGLFHPRGLDVDTGDNLYVADTGGGRIVKLSPSGERLGVFGRDDAGGPTLKQPTDVAVGPNGELFVTDSETSVVQALDPDGLPTARWRIPSADSLDGQHLAVAPDGTLYVTAPPDGAVSRFSAAGEPLGRIGSPGSGDGQLKKPVGVYVDRAGAVYVADTRNNRVQKFGR